MRRKLEEVLASQRTMLKHKAAPGDSVSDEQMETLFRRELEAFYNWVPKQPHLELIDVDYNRILSDPMKELARVHEFLGGAVDLAGMASVVDAKLYRNRV